jgi:two-component system cell cycle sensor histidine kinase/response regulator CckA
MKQSASTIYFPAAAQRAQANVTADQPAVVRGKETILVIEDDTSVRSLLVSVLRRSGYHVFEAADPSDALDIAGSIGQLDMVLVDLMLPEMSGIAVAAAVQTIWPDVQISFMSGYSDAEMIKRGLLHPADRFLQKPFRLEALTSHVRAVLGGAYDPRACAHLPDTCATGAIA